MRRFIAVVFLALLATQVFADEKKTFRAFTNNVSCEQVVASLEQPEGVSDFALIISSFVTGSNYAKSRDSTMDLKSMMVLTEQYCRQNPEWPATTVLVSLDKVIDRRIELEKQEGQ